MTPADPHPNPHRRHWIQTRRLTAALLLVWFGASFGSTYWARDLDFVFLGWPFSFWMAAQGSLIVYGLIIGVYAWAMHRLDRRHGVQEPEE